MTTAKEEVRKLLDVIPGDAAFEDIQYHSYVRRKVKRGLGRRARQSDQPGRS